MTAERPISVRVLLEEDARALRALRLRALLDAPDSFLSSYDEEAAQPESLTAERLRHTAGSRDSGVLGAFDGEALVGMLGLAREGHARAAHRARLWGMFVAPEARRLGAGRALVEAAARRLREAGVEQVHLTVATTAADARRLYTRAGFLVVGALAQAMKDGDRYVDEELMALRL